VHTEQIPIIYKSINYTEDIRQCIQKRYLYIPISQLHRRSEKVYTEGVPVYIYIYISRSITQRRYDNVCRRGIYIYQSMIYTEEVRHRIQKMYLYIPFDQIHRKGRTEYID
jgi:hypothetical protein